MGYSDLLFSYNVLKSYNEGVLLLINCYSSEMKYIFCFISIGYNVSIIFSIGSAINILLYDSYI